MTTETGHTASNEAVDVRSKAVRLFNYLKEMSRLKLVKVLDCRDYEELLWLHEIPHEPECSCAAWDESGEGGDVWIEVCRSPEPDLPAIPGICKDWVSLVEVQNSSKPPTLRERIVASTPTPGGDLKPPTFIELASHPEIQSAWEHYLHSKWERWAGEHQRWKRVQDVYGRLFSIYQQQKRLGESFELRLGLGLLCWQKPSGQRVFRHLILGQAGIVFDAHHGVIRVTAAGDGAKLSLEYDMLEPNETPVIEQHQAVEVGLEAYAESPWDRSAIDPLLRRWIHAMNQRGRYDGSLEPPEPAGWTPQVTFAPALILRKRTARTLVKMLDDIARNLGQGGEIPFGVLRLCEILDDVVPDVDGAPDAEEDIGVPTDAEVYFPLAANEEQQRIVDRLRSSRGVLVQGPPGTGKSHTIANLICHLLAEGKRVLVTSQTPRALKVLQEKIPKELSALCVSVLGNDVIALKNMENSVLGITERHHDWDAGGCEKNATRIRKCEDKLRDGRKRLAEIETRLRHLREIETYRHSVAGGSYQGTASDIAQRVTAEREQFGWLLDKPTEKQGLPLTVSSFPKLLGLLRHLTPERIDEVKRPCVNPDALPDVDRFLRMVKTESDAREICRSHAGRESSPVYKALLQCAPSARQVALEEIQRMLTAIANVKRLPLPWVATAVRDILSDQDRPWRELYDATESSLKNLCERAREAHERRIQLPTGGNTEQILADARELHQHLSNGGGLGFLCFRSSVARRTFYLTQTVRVNGRACAKTDVLKELIEQLDVENRIRNLWSLWAGIATAVEGPLPRQVAALEQCFQALELAIGLVPYLGKVKASVAILKGVAEPTWQDETAIGSFIADLQAAAAQDSLLESREAFDSLFHTLQTCVVTPESHPVCKQLADAVWHRDAKSYGEAWARLGALADDTQRLRNCEELTGRLEQSAPQLVSLLVRDPNNPIWDERIRRIEQSWCWSQASSWLADFHNHDNTLVLENELKATQASIQRIMAELAAEKAWRNCFQRLTESQRQHLMAWTDAVRRVGRGKGVRAEIHRRNARMHMEECRDAIPAWIMPFYRVAETVIANPEVFDVVIIDEASQSGPETLALFYLAKQCIVVGDDQQISPDAVGVVRSDVDLLSERLVSDLPHRDALGVDSSLFNQAVIRFGRRTVLREHFRCVPEIIRFSNDLCYSATPLIPLRQYPPQRLEPIVVRYVMDGFREGGANNVKNRPEAEALVDAIVQCCGDSRYRCTKDGRHPHEKLTFGVVSLQGEEQARLINQLLLNRLTPEEIEQRELICGDAYAFQGDERDVMFLSMVTAPNERFAALVKEADKRRFNVAASRARDQVWLFHSITLNELNPDDMRYKLLAYYSDPTTQSLGKVDWDKCESGFEREVGKLIEARNYRLIPQYEPFGPGGYRIDFVVEGLKSRLAIECDGPHHDDPEQIEHDMVRQRQLERCGWSFWRVKASSFYTDQHQAMASLWRVLETMDIGPQTASSISVQPTKAEEPPKQQMPNPQPRKPSPPARVAQIELLSPLQLELSSDSQQHFAHVGPPIPTPALDAEVTALVGKLRRLYPGFMPSRAICDVILALLPPAPQKINRKDLVKMAVNALNLPEGETRTVELEISRLDERGELSTGLGDNLVSRI